MCTVEDNPNDGHEWAELADDFRRDGELSTAGDYYAIAAYAHLAETYSSQYCKHISWALYRMLVAGVCYQMADQTERCRNRCQQGVLIAEDTAKRVNDLPIPDNAYDQARRGAWYEYLGDFRLVGAIDGVDEAYEQAKDIYRDAGDPSSGYSEQEHMRLHDFFQNVALSRGHDAEEWHSVEAEASLTTWVEYKRTHLPEYLDELYQQDEWEY